MIIIIKIIRFTIIIIIVIWDGGNIFWLLSDHHSGAPISILESADSHCISLQINSSKVAPVAPASGADGTGSLGEAKPKSRTNQKESRANRKTSVQCKPKFLLFGPKQNISTGPSLLPDMILDSLTWLLPKSTCQIQRAGIFAKRIACNFSPVAVFQQQNI